MSNITLKDLTDKQRLAWRMRYRYGWRMKRIALQLGIQVNSVCELLQRAHIRAGVPQPKHLSMLRSRPRAMRSRSLSSVFQI